MAKVILICGRICSGKTHYICRMRQTHPLVSLSCDDLMHALYRHQEGADFDEIAARVKAYLHRQAIEIVRAGADVALDWGFWTAEERQAVSAMYEAAQVPYQWHYIDVDDASWQRNIAARNAACLRGETTDYYVDEGLLAKLQSRFEVPDRAEMDVWYRAEPTE